MGEIRTFRDLHAWQAGMRVVEHTYKLTADFPNEERYGLVAQMRRAGDSNRPESGTRTGDEAAVRAEART